MGFMRGMCRDFGKYFGSPQHHYASHGPFAGSLMHIAYKNVKRWLKMNSSNLLGVLMNYEQYYYTSLENYCFYYDISCSYIAIWLSAI